MTLEIAIRLQKLRRKNGYSQEELANKLGVSRQAVSKWERAEASPDTDNLISLARLYGISVDELLNLSETSGETLKENVFAVDFSKSGSTNSENNVRTSPEKDSETIGINRSHKKFENIFNISVVCVCMAAYLLLGSLGGWWHPAWIVFLLIPILVSLDEAILSRDAVKFAYPVLTAAVYLFLGCVCNLWHPWWLIFVTIPIYYGIVEVAK